MRPNPSPAPLEASVWLEVSGLPLGTSEDAVKSIFTKFGYIEEFSFNRGKAEIKFNEPSVATSLCDSGTVVTLSGKNLKLATIEIPDAPTNNTTAFQPAAPKTSSGSNYVSCGGWFKAAQTKSVLAILRSKQITSVSVILEREEANAKTFLIEFESEDAAAAAVETLDSDVYTAPDGTTRFLEAKLHYNRSTQEPVVSTPETPLTTPARVAEEQVPASKPVAASTTAMINDEAVPETIVPTPAIAEPESGGSSVVAPTPTSPPPKAPLKSTGRIKSHPFSLTASGPTLGTALLNLNFKIEPRPAMKSTGSTSRVQTALVDDAPQFSFDRMASDDAAGPEEDEIDQQESKHNNLRPRATRKKPSSTGGSPSHGNGLSKKSTSTKKGMSFGASSKSSMNAGAQRKPLFVSSTDTKVQSNMQQLLQSGKMKLVNVVPARDWTPVNSMETNIRAMIPSGTSNLVSSKGTTKLIIRVQNLRPLQMRGPAEKVENFRKFMHRYAEFGEKVDTEYPYPCIIFSVKSPDVAHLNWEAQQMYGPWIRDQLNPLTIVVVQPTDEAEYAHNSPDSLLLILPESGRGQGFAKNVVKLFAQGAFATNLDGEFSIKIPFVWLCSDKIVRFVRLQKDKNSHALRRVGGAKMALHALLRAQTHPELAKYGLVGFMRDNGSAVVASVAECEGKANFSTCVLVNIEKTKEIPYNVAINDFSDRAFAMRLLTKDIPTLKIFDFCVWECVRKGASGSRIALRHVLIRTRFCGLDLYSVSDSSGLGNEDDVAESHVIEDWVRNKRAKAAADEDATDPVVLRGSLKGAPLPPTYKLGFSYPKKRKRPKMESAPVSADLILNVSDAPALSELVDLEKNEQADSSSKKSKATDAPAVNNVDAMDIDREPLPAEVSAPAPVPIPSVDHVVIVDEVCPYDAAKLLLRPEEYYIDDEDYIINASLSKVSGPRTKSHRSVKPRVRKPSLDDVVAPKRRAGKRKRRGYGNDESDEEIPPWMVEQWSSDDEVKLSDKEYDSDQDFDVDTLLVKRYNIQSGNRAEYLVKWEGELWNHYKWCTWVPRADMSCESKIEDFRPFWTGQLEKFKDLEERDSATHMVIKQRVDALNSLPKADKPLADEKDSAAAGSANKHDCNDDDWIDLEKSAEEINSEGECIGELKETEASIPIGKRRVRRAKAKKPLEALKKGAAPRPQRADLATWEPKYLGDDRLEFEIGEKVFVRRNSERYPWWPYQIIGKEVNNEGQTVYWLYKYHLNRFRQVTLDTSRGCPNILPFARYVDEMDQESIVPVWALDETRLMTHAPMDDEPMYDIADGDDIIVEEDLVELDDHNKDNPKQRPLRSRTATHYVDGHGRRTLKRDCT